MGCGVCVRSIYILCICFIKYVYSSIHGLFKTSPLPAKSKGGACVPMIFIKSMLFPLKMIKS